MHELGIASSIVESVEKESLRHPGVTITKVGVKVGDLSGVDVDALQFGFECIVKGTKWEQLLLEVESITRLQRCPQCGNQFRMADFDPRCQRCGQFATQCVSGDELDIAYMEVDE
jgi:hydrogenase nickel incorporation protein HypA/HybF